MPRLLSSLQLWLLCPSHFIFIHQGDWVNPSSAWDPRGTRTGVTQKLTLPLDDGWLPMGKCQLFLTMESLRLKTIVFPDCLQPFWEEVHMKVSSFCEIP